MANTDHPEHWPNTMSNPGTASEKSTTCSLVLFRLAYRPVYIGSKMKEVGSYEAKTKLPALLREVSDGTRYVITRSGKPVADLVPHSGLTEDPANVISKIREMRQGVTLGDNDLQELIQEGRR